MARQQCRNLFLEIFADVARSHRASRFHQDHATSLREAWLTAAVLAVDQFHKFFVQNSVAEQVRQTRNRLLDGTDSLHDFGALLKQLTQFVVALAG